MPKSQMLEEWNQRPGYGFLTPWRQKYYTRREKRVFSIIIPELIKRKIIGEKEHLLAGSGDYQYVASYVDKKEFLFNYWVQSILSTKIFEDGVKFVCEFELNNFHDLSDWFLNSPEVLLLKIIKNFIITRQEKEELKDLKDFLDWVALEKIKYDDEEDNLIKFDELRDHLSSLAKRIAGFYGNPKPPTPILPSSTSIFQGVIEDGEKLILKTIKAIFFTYSNRCYEHSMDSSITDLNALYEFHEAHKLPDREEHPLDIILGNILSSIIKASSFLKSTAHLKTEKGFAKIIELILKTPKFEYYDVTSGQYSSPKNVTFFLKEDNELFPKIMHFAHSLSYFLGGVSLFYTQVIPICEQFIINIYKDAIKEMLENLIEVTNGLEESYKKLIKNSDGMYKKISSLKKKKDIEKEEDSGILSAILHFFSPKNRCDLVLMDSFKSALAYKALIDRKCIGNTYFFSTSELHYFHFLNGWESITIKGCDLYLMSELPNINNKAYQNCFIYISKGSNKNLFYIKDSGKPDLLSITNIDMFDMELLKIMGLETYKHLTDEQIQNLITSNGGNTPISSEQHKSLLAKLKIEPLPSGEKIRFFPALSSEQQAIITSFTSHAQKRMDDYYCWVVNYERGKKIDARIQDGDFTSFRQKIELLKSQLNIVSSSQISPSESENRVILVNTYITHALGLMVALPKPLVNSHALPAAVDSDNDEITSASATSGTPSKCTAEFCDTGKKYPGGVSATLLLASPTSMIEDIWGEEEKEDVIATIPPKISLNQLVDSGNVDGISESTPMIETPVTSSATRSASVPLWAKPLSLAGSVVGASLTGAKAVGSGVLGLAGGAWSKVSGTVGYVAGGVASRIWGTTPASEAKTKRVEPVPHAETKSSGSTRGDGAGADWESGPKGVTMPGEYFRVTPSNFTLPRVSGMELLQVGVPLLSKLSEQYGLFGYKPLTFKLAAQYEMQHQEQLEEIKASLDEMQNHSILKQRVEYHMAKEAFEQAQLRFRNYFQDTVDTDHSVTESENAEVSRLMDIAQQTLTVVEALQMKIDEEHPGFVEKVKKITAEQERVWKELQKMERSFAARIKEFQKQQLAITEKLMVEGITKEQEAKLDAEWDRLDKVIIHTRNAGEEAEPIYGALTYLLEKISDQLEAGCLPEQLASLQRNLDLVKAAMTEIAAGNTNYEKGILAKVIAIADMLREKEATATYLQCVGRATALETQRKAPVLTDFFVTDRTTDRLVASTASHVMAAPPVHAPRSTLTIPALRV